MGGHLAVGTVTGRPRWCDAAGAQPDFPTPFLPVISTKSPIWKGWSAKIVTLPNTLAEVLGSHRHGETADAEAREQRDDVVAQLENV